MTIHRTASSDPTRALDTPGRSRASRPNVRHAGGDSTGIRAHPSLFGCALSLLRVTQADITSALISKPGLLSHSVETGKWSDIAVPVKCELLEHAALAQALYQDTQYTLKTNRSNTTDASNEAESGKNIDAEPWQPTTIVEIRQAVKKIIPDVTCENGRYVDYSSGLVFQVFEKPGKKEVMLAFGGTSAGRHNGKLATRIWKNSAITIRQWRANLSSATGVALTGKAVPDAYQKASDIARAIRDILPKDWKFGGTGHSLGGSLAAYAAAKNKLHATCFGTPEFGIRMLEDIGEENLKGALNTVRHVFVNGDPVPSVSAVLPPRLQWQAHFGKIYRIEPAPELANMWLRPLMNHDQFFLSQLKAS